MNTPLPLAVPVETALEPSHESGRDLPAATSTSSADAAADVLTSLLQARPARSASDEAAPAPALPAVVIGELLALADDGVPCIRFAGQAGSAALRARSVVDLRASDIGQALVLAFEHGDAHRPIVMGVLRNHAAATLPPGPQVQVDADGQHLTVSAREQLVLRCGKASITLTQAGKVLVEGTYVSSRSTGVNRIKGGSVQLN